MKLIKERGRGGSPDVHGDGWVGGWGGRWRAALVGGIGWEGAPHLGVHANEPEGELALVSCGRLPADFQTFRKLNQVSG